MLPAGVWWCRWPLPRRTWLHWPNGRACRSNDMILIIREMGGMNVKWYLYSQIQPCPVRSTANSCTLPHTFFSFFISDDFNIWEHQHDCELRPWEMFEMWRRKKIAAKLDPKHKQDSIAWKSKSIWRKKHFSPTERVEKSTEAKELEAGDQNSAEPVSQEIPCYLHCRVLFSFTGKSKHTRSLGSSKGPNFRLLLYDAVLFGQ